MPWTISYRKNDFCTLFQTKILMPCLTPESLGECIEHVTGASDKPFQHVHGGCKQVETGFCHVDALNYNDKEVTSFKSMANSRP